MASLSNINADAIALTEKKMDMTLDDIIKMSQKNNRRGSKVAQKDKKQKNFANSKVPLGAAKAQLQRSVAARSSALRQGKLAELRSKNGLNQFNATKEASKRVAAAPIRNVIPFRNSASVRNGPPFDTRPPWIKRSRAVIGTHVRQNSLQTVRKVTAKVQQQRSQTLDALFANIREQRMKRSQTQFRTRQMGFVGQQRNFNVRARISGGYQNNLAGRLKF